MGLLFSCNVIASCWLVHTTQEIKGLSSNIAFQPGYISLAGITYLVEVIGISEIDQNSCQREHLGFVVSYGHIGRKLEDDVSLCKVLFSELDFHSL